ncbi:DUF6103 family protein [Lacrimispora saccharolytica]|uniref:Uncharacterized protein n=1 Tax=Lacrimispora saccharolytica (strain ATCC 35040 / DSM 2544 / NRCC 2533 / WM1) TaxID=610130 RepID=D9R6E0_LACSW|nr:DUF6103 family protein [Lacrimispora saccharolytica]ADL05350.1 conserved hypothetical protein [[Clostridium] saccharolyticum WM1]QRV20482.1 hypothetical protein I6K70_02750 [Lacrimispora saccharolytica]
MSITTEKATIQVSFSKEKLDALKFYMDEKDTTLEKELQSHVRGVYEKYVPAATRRYLDRNDSGTEIQAEVTLEAVQPEQEIAPQPAQSTRGRRRINREQNEETGELNQAEITSASEENQEQVEDENQGMSMSM